MIVSSQTSTECNQGNKNAYNHHFQQRSQRCWRIIAWLHALTLARELNDNLKVSNRIYAPKIIPALESIQRQREHSWMRKQNKSTGDSLNKLTRWSSSPCSSRVGSSLPYLQQIKWRGKVARLFTAWIVRQEDLDQTTYSKRSQAATPRSSL